MSQPGVRSKKGSGRRVIHSGRKQGGRGKQKQEAESAGIQTTTSERWSKDDDEEARSCTLDTESREGNRPKADRRIAEGTGDSL